MTEQMKGCQGLESGIQRAVHRQVGTASDGDIFDEAVGWEKANTSKVSDQAQNLFGALMQTSAHEEVVGMNEIHARQSGAIDAVGVAGFILACGKAVEPEFMR